MTVSPHGICTSNAASTLCTTSAVVALGDRVSILKDWSLLCTEKREEIPGEEGQFGSQSASTVMVSFPLTRVRELVSKLADPKLPRFTHLLAHTAAWPVSSCRARPETWPTKVSGIGLLECAAGALHIFALILHVLQKMKRSGHLWVPLFILRHPKQMIGSAVRRSLLSAQEIKGQEPIP